MPHPRIHSAPAVKRRKLGVKDHVAGVLARDRSIIARTITLIESQHPEHEQMAEEVLLHLLPHTGGAMRVGITGIPGAGKSTFIEALGRRLTAEGHMVAVLAIDPSSTLTGGSILGDKTRMSELSADPRAFIRPSPSSGTLGGVAKKTRETMLVCEAGGYDVIFVETVGVGQSETIVDEMVDFFLVLMVAGAGDELQGIKRGVLELADLVIINKADGDNQRRAELARSEYHTALHFMRQKHEGWPAEAMLSSALTGMGLKEIWEKIGQHRAFLEERGVFVARRHQQLVRWMWSLVEERLLTSLHQHPQVKALRASLEAQVVAGQTTATDAARRILQAYTTRP